MALIDGIGFGAMDAGTIAGSWRQQPGSSGYLEDYDVAAVRRALAEATIERKPEWRATPNSPGGYRGPTLPFPKKAKIMLDRRHLIGAALAALTIGGAGTSTVLTPEAAAQSGAPTAASGALSANDRLAQLGPEGEELAKRMGTWDATFTEWEKTGAAPVTTGGLVAEREMIGPMLEERLHTVREAPGKEWTRIDDLTFNRVTSRWDYMSMDTRAAVGLMPAWSLDRDPPSRISVSFMPFALAGDGAKVTGQLLRMEQVITQSDADHETKDQYFMPADGSGTKWLAKRYSYTRRH